MSISSSFSYHAPCPLGHRSRSRRHRVTQGDVDLFHALVGNEFDESLADASTVHKNYQSQLPAEEFNDPAGPDRVVLWILRANAWIREHFASDPKVLWQSAAAWADSAEAWCRHALSGHLWQALVTAALHNSREMRHKVEQLQTRVAAARFSSRL